MDPRARLRDIEDIASIPWWPPGPGWWLVALGVLLLAALVWRWRWPLLLQFPIPALTLGSWRREAALALRQLRRRVHQGEDARLLIGEFSELLRRIAMARCGRAACAGLSGADWLDWLAAHDPHGFVWSEHARALLDQPYAPPDRAAIDALPPLIEAALGWVDPTPARACAQERAHV